MGWRPFTSTNRHSSARLLVSLPRNNPLIGPSKMCTPLNYFKPGPRSPPIRDPSVPHRDDSVDV